MVSPILAVLRLSLFSLWTVLLLPPFLLLRLVRRDLVSAYIRFYWRRVTRLLGFEVIAHGRPAESDGPVLFVPNHASYLDIIVLGSLLRAFFVAKDEVAAWPVFGFLARISNTVFIDRSRRATARERDQVRDRLEAGDSLILFAEGTSNDGNRVMPFKSSLLAVAERDAVGPDGERRPMPVQPVSIAYTRLDGFSLMRAFRPFYAWYGDMTLARHLIGALGLGRLTVEVEFHPPVTLTDCGSRKELAAHCHKAVSFGVTRLLAGR